MSNAFGLTPANHPPKHTRSRPSPRASWSEWMDYCCYRGIGCGGDQTGVHVGYGFSSEPIDQAMSVNILYCTFSPAEARHLAIRLQQAADHAERLSISP